MEKKQFELLGKLITESSKLGLMKSCSYQDKLQVVMAVNKATVLLRAERGGTKQPAV